MKKWQVLVASLVALLVLIVTPLSVMAQSPDGTTASARLRPRGSLALVAPRVALIGHEMSLTVLLRYNQAPVENAAVWTIAKENAQSLKEDLKALGEKGLVNVTGEDYQVVLEVSGTLLGRTDEKGRLTHSFDESGNYLLVALKPGYFPDFSALTVRDILALEAPRKVALGEEVIMTVTQKGTGNPVSEAGVWYVARADIPTVKERLEVVKKANKGHLWEVDWESILNEYATPIGRTGESGQLTYAFETAGGYLLITAKTGYIPHYAGIAIIDPSTAPDVTGAIE
jgi:hypothetical protein